MSDLEPIPAPSRWMRYYLKYVSPYAGHGMRAVLIFQRIDDGAPTEDADFRVWCQELILGTLWCKVESAPEGPGVLRIFFPSDDYEGMAPYTDIEVPPKPRVGTIWRLRAPHNPDPEVFRLESVKEITDTDLAAEEQVMLAPP